MVAKIWRAGDASRPRILLSAPLSYDRGSHQSSERLGAALLHACSGRTDDSSNSGRPSLVAIGRAYLSGVRVHTDGEADRLSRSVSAAAFTTGPNIFFRSGTYNPSSSKGLQLLAHEATHVIQQASGPVAGTPAPGGVSISNPGDSF